MVGCATLAARGRDRAAGALAALSILTRPDAVVPLGGMLVGSLLATADPRALVRRCVRAAAWCVVPVALHLAWRQAYYGAWLPHTWAVKRHGVGLAGAHGRAYLTVWLRDLPIAALLPGLLLARRRHLPLVFGVVATWAYVVSVGGDFMAYGRFLHGSLALLAMLHGGVPAGDGVVQRGFGALRRRRLDDAYSLATALCATAALARYGRLTDGDRRAAARWRAAQCWRECQCRC